MNPHHPLHWIDQELKALQQRGLRRSLAVRCGPQTPARIEVDARSLINFSSNDYLGLAAEALLPAVAAAMQGAGWGSGASPLVTGRDSWHAKLERRLAEFEQTEAALLFTTGYAANVGAITTLAERTDAIFSDAKNHASIIDGCRLSGAHVHIYSHRNVADLSRQLVDAAGRFRRRLIVTDGLFSMDGDLAPLADLAELAARHDAMLMVDEAHATGVFGEQGRGVSEAAGVESAVHVRIGTLSKALGSHGGFVAGSRSLIDLLANRARTYIFATAAPGAVCAAGLAALQQVGQSPQRRQDLLRQAGQLRQRLQQAGLDTGDSASQIIPVVVGDPQRAVALSGQLREQGLLVPAIRPPSVPQGRSLLRISLTAAHTPDMMERLLAALVELRPKILGR